MRRIGLAALVLLAAGCAIPPSTVEDGGDAPTGVSPTVTLYFVDAQGRLRPDERHTGNLGSIGEAVSLLLTGPGGAAPALHTEIAVSGTTRVYASTEPGLITLTLPLTRDEVTDRGVDQVVCTALGVHVQSGGSATTRVQLSFTHPGADPHGPRTCPAN
ncbi:hypothetical protein [Crossiella cryophila]|uniref:GerMN domain-containing protein n=1 Tax=Crossiella cryophila TaxID=43355 RepID=A0A7W7CII6_9PSEU|nr:hypothetical protein [Crossiella cryophila]MBB4680373.1 hypothetical protein [Crossiella cryophila]